MLIGIRSLIPRIYNQLFRLILFSVLLLRHGLANGNTLSTSSSPVTTGTTTTTFPTTSSESGFIGLSTFASAASTAAGAAVTETNRPEIGTSSAADYLVLPLIQPTVDSILSKATGGRKTTGSSRQTNKDNESGKNPPQTELTNRIETDGYGSKGDNKKLQKVVDSGGEHEHADNNMLEELYRTPMSFGTENLTMITTQVGATAYLPCLVHFIGESVVSWIRKKDYHLLTVALQTYSSDERFTAKHLKTSEDWTLQIKYVQHRDEGTYECQVSSHPPSSIYIYLNVIEARAEIIGPPIRYLTPDSTLRLICRVVQSTETSLFLFWYHDDRMINYDTDRGINITTEADYHYSELTILRATKKHSGNYSCVPSNSQPASVLIHIFKGDNPAAMHHDVNGGFHILANTQPLSTTFLIVLMLFLQLLSVLTSS